MTRPEAIAAMTALKSERAAIWANVTGSTTHGQKGHEVMEVHGVTGAQIGRVAKINGEIVRLAQQFDLYALGI